MNLAAHVLGTRFPGTALICGADEIGWDELAAGVARSAGGLRALGVQPGERVVLVLRDTPAFVKAWLGAVHAGAVPVALNGNLSADEYRHIRADSGARLALIEPQFAAARAAFAGLCADLVDGAPAPAFAAHADSPAFCIYSSGTTGMPKGIVHAHRLATHLGEAFRLLDIRQGARVLCTSRLFFAYGLEHGLLAPLACGATSILIADTPDPAALIAAVARHRPQTMFSVPTVYRRLVAERADELEPLRGMRRFVAAGERLSPQLVERWRRATGGELLNLYGTSEAFCACMMTPPGTSDGVRTGVPFGMVELRVDEGLLWIRHPGQARGYLNRPRETQAQFRDGWFCSRDLFVRDDEGFYVHQGRSDELVKVAGQWVWPNELEEVALATAAVAEAVCVAVSDADGLQRLALFVTASGTEDPVHAAALACERLPRHKRPKWIRAVTELPRTATGKVQRYKLREILESELARSG